MAGSHVQAAPLNNNNEPAENIGPSENNREQGDEATHYVAIIQNRANEVGLAALELRGRSRLYLAQYVESTRSFANTLSMVQRFIPKKLLLVSSKEGIAESAVNTVLRPYQSCILPLPRAYFDDTEGMVLTQNLASSASQACLEAGKGTYLALGAAGALIKFIQNDQSMLLVPRSLTVIGISTEHHMVVDATTVEALELVQPIAVGSSGRKGMTLFKLLDGTRTKAGAQLLRAQLLQPLQDIPTLQLRYEAVSELKSQDELFCGIDACMAAVPKNLDSLCTSLILRPAKSEANTIQRIAAMVKSFILLRDTLRLLSELAIALETAECEIFSVLYRTCSDQGFKRLLTQLEDLLEPDVHASTNAFLNRTQCCFALKSGVDSLLDVARATFSRLTENVHQLADNLRQQHHRIPHMKVQYTARRGFSFSIGSAPKSRKNNNNNAYMEEEEQEEHQEEQQHERTMPSHYNTDDPMQISPNRGSRPQQQQQQRVKVPPGFTILQSNGRVVQCTTSELNALNSRIKAAGDDCLVLTEKVLESLSQEIVTNHLPALNTLVDGIALLDMLLGFARSLENTGKEPYCVPTLTESGPIVIVEGRHPILEVVEETPFQANDTYLALNASFHVITGANMSGKSTYLRQVALTVIMAQIGCLVPAQFMSLTPVHALFTRMGTGDSLETNNSSFMVEMQETAHILKNATSKSLVLIDELGRATSTGDGQAISWAVSEALIDIGARTLFATHFHQLTDLANVYPNVRCWNMAVDVSRSRLDFQWKIQPGFNDDVGHYGLLLAKSVGFPEDLLQKASQVVDAVEAGEGDRMKTVFANEAQQELEDGWTVVGNMACVAQTFKESKDMAGLQRGLLELKELTFGNEGGE